MDCDRVERDGIADRYLLRRLSDEDRDAFEAHYFECERCFGDVRSLEAIGEELKATDQRLAGVQRPTVRWMPGVAAAAAVVLVAGTFVWLRSPSTPDRSPTTAPPSASEAPILEAPDAEPEAPPASADLSIAQLARIEPPPFEPPTLRGAPDEATAGFLRGMERYRQADYAGAIADLRGASQLDPQAPHVLFFLGVSYLLSGQEIAAIDRLEATIALGDSAYFEEAHWYLAKAHVRRNNLTAAKAMLRDLSGLRGPGSGDARHLLAQIEALERQ